MLKSAVSSHITTIYTARKSKTNYFVNIGNQFGNDNINIVVLADGTTNSARILQEMKRIFESQHVAI